MGGPTDMTGKSNGVSPAATAFRLVRFSMRILTVPMKP